MSNEPEIGKEMSKEEKLAGISDTLQNTVRVEQIAKDSSGTALGAPSSICGNNMEVLENTHHSNTGKNTEPSKELSEKYRLIASNTSDLIAFTTFDVDPVFTFVNPSYLKILGFKADELLGKSWFAFIHQDDKQQMRAILIKYIDAKINGILPPDMGEEAQKLDFRILDKSGHWHFLHSTINIVNEELLFISKDITERKHAEEMLHRSEEMFSKVFRLSPESITLTSLKEGRYVDVNESFLHVIGYSRDEVIGRTATELNIWIDPNDRARLIQGLKEQGSIRNLEIRMRTKSGGVGTVLMSSEIITINNEPCALTVTTNITDRKRTEETLQENEKRMKSIIQGLSIAAFVIDSNHRVLYWNKALEELSNIRAEEIIGTTNHWKAFYTQKRPCMADILIDGGLNDIEKWYAGRYNKSSLLGESFEATDFFPNLGGNGKWLRFTATVIRNTNRDLIGVLETLEDISERKIAEIALQQSEEKYRSVFNNFIDLYYQTDMKGIITNVSPSCFVLSGWKPEELIGRQVLELYPDPEQRKVLLEKLLREGAVSDHEITLLNRDGRHLSVSVSSHLIRDEQANPKCVEGTIRDITERKRVDEALRASEERFRLAVSGLTDILYQWNIKTNTIEWFGDIDRRLGYASGTFPRTLDAFLNHIHPEDVNNVQAVATNGLKSHQKWQGEYRVINKDGTNLYWYGTGIGIYDQERNPIKVVGAVTDITERKRAEDKMRRSEEQYRLVTDNASDIIWTMDLNLRFTYFSPSNEKLTGYTTEKALKLSLDELLTPESMERALQSFTGQMELENNEEKDLSRYVTLELNEKRADGTILPVEVRMCFLRDAQNNPVGILGISRDVTERKKTDEALARSEYRYRNLYNNLRDGSAAVDLQGKIIECNPAFEKMLGYSIDELRRMTFQEITPMKWHDIEKRILEEQVIRRGYSDLYEKEYRNKDGKILPIELQTYAVRNNEDQLCGFWAFIRDITVRKQLELILKESEEKYRSIVENTSDVIMLTNPDGRVSYISPACVRVLGYNPDELVGKIPEIFYSEDIEKVHHALSSAMQGSSGSNLQYRILTKNGISKWVSHSWSPILTENHELQCIASIVRDITESKIAEQTLKMKIEELEKYKSVTVNREVKMVDLKNEINELCKQLNQKPKYPNV
jgi:PAS domain S-box-containing protein